MEQRMATREYRSRARPTSGEEVERTPDRCTDITFGDFSALGLEEYQAIFQGPLQSSDVEFPWDDKSLARSIVPNAAGNAGPQVLLKQPPPPLPQNASFLSNNLAASGSYPQNSQVVSSNAAVSDPPSISGQVLNNSVAVSSNLPQSGPIVSNNVAGSHSSCAGPTYYSLVDKSSTEGVGAREYPEVKSQEWINQSPGSSESFRQTSAVVSGPDASHGEGTKKRRNKKRRDPEYYKSYYDRVHGSLDDSGAENSSGKEDLKYGGSEEPTAPSVPNEQSEYKPETATAPTPNYEYNADEKSTERTSSYSDPVYQSTDDMLPRTYENDKQEKNEGNVPSSVNSPAVDIVNVNEGTGIDSHSIELGSVDVVSNIVPSVPTIHISPSESAGVQSGDSFDESFPAATAESSAGVQTAVAAPAFGAPQSSATGQPPTTAPSTAPRAPMSWASLFKSSPGSEPSQKASTPYVAISVTSEPAPGDVPEDDSVSLVTTDKDPHAKKLGEHLSKVIPSHHPMNLQPRGLINTANWCYINSILQALLSCPPFYHIMKNMPLNNEVRKSSSTPMLDAMYQFLKEFQELKGLSKRTPLDIRPGPCFEPTVIYQMLSVAQTSLSVKHGRQEDAEEFLSCLLNGLHDEMTSLIQLYNGEDVQPDPKPNGPSLSSSSMANGDVDSSHGKEVDDEDEWEQVGPRNKTSITRRAQFSSSPLSKIFGGIMRSALHQHGSKESATLQPFFSLQLDIQSTDIWTVQNALDTLGNRESVHGFMSNKTKKEVEAFRRITLEELPPVLILHLKRFLYDKSGGCQKLMKKVDYTMEIEINKELISPNAKSKIGQIQRTYKLFAVVYHTGKEASGGHYITDVYHVGTSGWLRCDDSIVKPVMAKQVIKPLTTCIPYLLFYRRKDLLTKPVTS